MTKAMTLTSHKREILRLMASGFEDQDIADALHLSRNTIKTHVKNILAILGAENRTHAAVIALGLGILSFADIEEFKDRPTHE